MNLFIAINENSPRRECGIFIQKSPGGDGFFLGSFDYDEAIELHQDLERINKEIICFALNHLKPKETECLHQSDGILHEFHQDGELSILQMHRCLTCKKFYKPEE